MTSTDRLLLVQRVIGVMKNLLVNEESVELTTSPLLDVERRDRRIISRTLVEAVLWVNLMESTEQQAGERLGMMNETRLSRPDWSTCVERPAPQRNVRVVVRIPPSACGEMPGSLCSVVEYAARDMFVRCVMLPSAAVTLLSLPC